MIKKEKEKPDYGYGRCKICGFEPAIKNGNKFFYYGENCKGNGGDEQARQKK